MSQPLEILTRNDILLRQFNRSDAASIFVFAQENRMQLQELGINFEYSPTLEILDALSKPRENDVRFSIWIKRNMIGGIIYTPIHNPDEVKLDFLLGLKFQGKGYMTEVVGALTNHLFIQERVKEVFVKVKNDDYKTKRLMERLDFTKTMPHPNILKYYRTSQLPVQY